MLNRIEPVKRSEAPPNLNARGFDNEQIIDNYSENSAHGSKPSHLSRNHVEEMMIFVSNFLDSSQRVYCGRYLWI